MSPVNCNLVISTAAHCSFFNTLIAASARSRPPPLPQSFQNLAHLRARHRLAVLRLDLGNDVARADGPGQRAGRLTDQLSLIDVSRFGAIRRSLLLGSWHEIHLLRVIQKPRIELIVI